jgi:hypothetical protein
MQKIIENGTTVLIADDGMKLADGSSFGSVVRLGKEADESVWYEITEEEAEKRMDDNRPDAEEATVEDYQSALSEFGVNVRQKNNCPPL